MKRIVIFIFGIVLALGAMAANPTASGILEAMRKTMLAKPALEAKFTINGGDGAVQGSMTMSGACFYMSTPQLKDRKSVV